MMKVTLGNVGITVNKSGFGTLPIQRISDEDAVCLIRKACEGDINFFDTARCYSDSEEEVGIAPEGIRGEAIMATKTMSTTVEGFWESLKVSLDNLKMGHVDIYQFHNPSFCLRPGDSTDLYETMLEAEAQGKIKHIGITNHRLSVTNEAIDSGLYKTLQFPFCYLATDKDIELMEKCRKADMGFIAMKAPSRGLIDNSGAVYVYLARFDSVLPIWGAQRESELDEFLSYIQEPPVMTQELEELIRHDREQLQGEFCRDCGYYVSHPVSTEISNCARISLMIRGSPSEAQLTPQIQEEMKLIEKYLHCGQCRGKCPYGLGTPTLLEKNLKDYPEILDGKKYQKVLDCYGLIQCNA